MKHFPGVKNCAEVGDFAGCAAGTPRKPVPRLTKTPGAFLNSVYAGPQGEPQGWGE
ncbi:hypothetical protein GCM10007171_30090 [Dickeya fangzhongdai]|nr:hypothetical protein GCM10007171_30090 [Dickeya fangzhongdai]